MATGRPAVRGEPHLKAVAKRKTRALHARCGTPRRAYEGAPPTSARTGNVIQNVSARAAPTPSLRQGLSHRQRATPKGRASLRRRVERSVRKNGACRYGSYLPGLPVSETTETPKGERDQSMPGNASKPDVAVRRRAQSKVCTVKAVLPQSQIPVAKGLAVANAADTLCHAGWIAWSYAIHHLFAWDDLHRGIKESKGTPKHTATPRIRHYEIACSRFINGPVWRRSRHSTQTLGVMAETAIVRWTVKRIRQGNRIESATDRGKDDAVNNGICSKRRGNPSTERFC